MNVESEKSLWIRQDPLMRLRLNLSLTVSGLAFYVSTLQEEKFGIL
jgi:hypothetical protein